MLIYPVFVPFEGCPFRCIFCDQRSIIHDSEDLSQALESAKTFLDRHRGKARQIAFYGGSFTGIGVEKRNRILAYFDNSLDAEVSFRISTRPDLIDAKILDWCQGKRIKTIELGIQDFSDKVLKETLRGYSYRIAVNACEMVKDQGIELSVQLMPGLPGADQDTLAITKKALLQIKPAFLRLYPCVVLKDTHLAALYQAGQYTPLALEEAINICADYCEFAAQNGIKIIKLGLPSNLSCADVLAGPYHHAFGEFVLAELLVRKIVDSASRGILLPLNPAQQALLRAHQHKYCKILKNRLETCTIDQRLRELCMIQGATKQESQELRERMF